MCDFLPLGITPPHSDFSNLGLPNIQAPHFAQAVINITRTRSWISCTCILYILTMGHNLICDSIEFKSTVFRHLRLAFVVASLLAFLQNCLSIYSLMNPPVSSQPIAFHIPCEQMLNRAFFSVQEQCCERVVGRWMHVSLDLESILLCVME